MKNSEHIGPLIKIAGNLIEQRVNFNSEKLGLTSGQMHILHFICKNRDNGVCQREIEDNFELSHATVSGIVARLEAKQFVRCTPDEKDKRFKSVFPTEKAVECDSQMSGYIDETENLFTAGFSEGEKSEIRNYLIRILENLGVEKPLREEKR